MTQLTKAGELVLSKIYLVNSTKDSKVDLTGLFVELDLYEDLFSNSMSGTVTMVEGFNLITDLPIIGEEFLELEFFTPSLEQYTVSKTFFVYKVSNRVVSDKKSVYLLNIISQEGIIDLNTKVSHAFNGYTHEIAQTIFSKYFTHNTILTEESTNSLKFVSNYWSPFKCINYAASRSTAKDAFQTPTFLFYETNKQFKFLSLNTLYNQKAATEYFYDNNPKRTDIGTGSQRDIKREMQTAESLDIDCNFDYIQRIMNGVYSHKVYDFNILKKTISKKTYNYWYDFESTQHLEKNPMVSEYVEFDDENGRIDWRTTYPYVHNTFKQDNSATIYDKRISLLAQTEMYKIDIVVPGRTDLEVGQVVNFNMMKYETAGKTDNELDKYYSGRYLIGAIQHRITQTRHKMTLQLLKDSFVEQVTFKDSM